MNDTLTPVRSLDQDRRLITGRDDRVRLVDRLSLRVGLWLMLRAERRIDNRRDVDVRAQRDGAAQALREHDLAVARALQARARIY